MSYSTYLGANTNKARDDPYGVAVDTKGLIVVTGRTQSAEFPMTVGGPTIYNSAPYLEAGVSNDQPYVVKIDPTLSGDASLAYSTFLGGGSADGQWGSFCTSVGVDALGTVYVGGETNAPGVPYVPNNPNSPQEFPYTPYALLTPRSRGATTPSSCKSTRAAPPWATPPTSAKAMTVPTDWPSIPPAT